MDDLDALMGELAAAGTSGRTSMDRYRDFREVFMGSDVGKRVLHDIFAWGWMYRSTEVRGDPHETYRRGGERALALRILATLHVEPGMDRPTAQVTTEE